MWLLFQSNSVTLGAEGRNTILKTQDVLYGSQQPSGEGTRGHSVTGQCAEGAEDSPWELRGPPV